MFFGTVFSQVSLPLFVVAVAPLVFGKQDVVGPISLVLEQLAAHAD